VPAGEGHGTLEVSNGNSQDAAALIQVVNAVTAAIAHAARLLRG